MVCYAPWWELQRLWRLHQVVHSQCEVATNASADALAWHLNAEGTRTTQQTICHIQHALQIVKGNGESNCAWHVRTRNLKYFGSFRNQSRWGRRSKRNRWRCRVAHQADDARRQLRNRCSCKPTLALKSIVNAKGKERKQHWEIQQLRLTMCCSSWSACAKRTCSL